MVSESAVAAVAQGHLDSLTALGDTLALLERLDQALPEVTLQARPLTLLQLDVDRFGELNEREGRDAGDALLVRLAGVLRAFAARQGTPDVAPPTAEAFRVGSDEFALLLPRTGRLRARRLAAELIAEAAGERISLSVGIGVAEPGATDLGSLLLAADGALRAVQSRGGMRARLLTRAPEDAAGATGVVDWLTRHTIDITEQFDRVAQMALTDPLTNLPNQRALTQFLQTEIPRALRHERPFAILLIDGDNLRDYNQQYGYPAGDEWIRQLGRLLVAETRGSDLTVRWRVGDEFVIAMPETTRDAAVQAAERIRAAVALATGQLPIPATISIGVAAFPDDGTTDEALLERAGAANALAKQRGRNQIAFITDPPDGA